MRPWFKQLAAAALATLMICTENPCPVAIVDGAEYSASVSATSTSAGIITTTQSTSPNSGSCGENVKWTLSNDGVLTISGEGEMRYFSLYEKKQKIKTIKIEDGVTSISANAFSECTNLQSVTIPDSVKSLGRYAFQKCSALKTITLPESLASIGDYAFSGCTSLSSIAISDQIKSIGEDAFAQTPWLEEQRKSNPLVILGSRLIDGTKCRGSVVIPDGVTTINAGAFKSCAGLTSVSIPDSVTAINGNAFSYCYNIKSLKLPKKLLNIGYQAFFGCFALESITFPECLESIGMAAFAGCDSLTVVRVPAKTKLDRYVFNDCNSLQGITVDQNNINVKDVDGVLFSKDGTVLMTYPKARPASTYRIPDSVTTIQSLAFGHNPSLVEMTIPESVTKLQAYAFAECSSLQKVTVLNPECEFDLTQDLVSRKPTYATIPTTATIYGYEGSPAEEYAKIVGTAFVAIDSDYAFTKPTVTSMIGIGYTVPYLLTRTTTTAPSETEHTDYTETTGNYTMPYPGETTATYTAPNDTTTTSTKPTVAQETTTTTTKTTPKPTATTTTTTTTETTTTPALKPTLLGDFSLDGVVNVGDAVLIARAAASDRTLVVTAQARVNGDVDGSGVIDSKDLTRILMALGKKIKL